MLLNQFITEPFDVPVWRMQIDETTDTLFLELRDNTKKQVSFAGIDLQSGQTNFKDLIMPERWLCGIESAVDGVLLLHGYQSATMPAHKELTGISAATGRVLWADYNLTFDALNANGVTVFDARIQPKKTFVIDAKTGQRKGVNIPANEHSNSHITLPQIVQSEMLPRELLVLEPYANVVHYLKHNNFRIVSLHALDGGLFKQFLYVFDSDYKLLFSDIMNSDIQKLQPEAFISYKNKLIWLKNQSVLNVLNL